MLAAMSVVFAPSLAMAADWQKVAGGNVRLLLNPAPDKTDTATHPAIIQGVIELELKPGWKTYWSNPGNSGMPPAITVDQPAAAEILFPVPQLYKSGNAWSYGYKGHVLLPFRITPLQPLAERTLSGSVTVGICDVLCMPEKIPFQFRTDTQPDLLTQGKIKAAFTALPQAASANFRIKQLTQAGGQLRVVLRHPESAATPQLFMDGHDIQLGIAEVKKHSPTQTVYHVPILFGKAAANQSFSYTAMINGQAITGNSPLQTH